MVDNNLPMILIILDGWGIGKKNKGNAISLAKTPFLDSLKKEYLYTELHASGRYVGLPKDQPGNSEAGHMNIGAGRLVRQDSVIVSEAIKNGTFFKNPAFRGAIRHVKKMKSKMHVIGMLSNGESPHSDPNHLIAILELLKKNNIKDVYLHLYTDGRDSPRYASVKLIKDLEKKYLDKYLIATIMGRFYAMDRKKKWSRTEKAYFALTKGEGRRANTADEAILESYNRGESDEFIEPCVIGDKENTRIEDGDSIIFFNLRSDRSRQLTKAFVQEKFTKKNHGCFKRGQKLKHLYFVAMTDFGPDLDDIITAYPGVDISNTLPVLLKDLKQLYLAETEKYAHVTYFFNGGYPGTVANEKQLMIESPDVKSYDETPGMNTKKLTKVVMKNIDKKDCKYDFTLLNIAAPDMIGHAGNIKAGIKTCEIVDKEIKKVVKKYLNINGTVVITADHGNVEEMINIKTDEIYTEHTTSLVPFILVNNKKKTSNKLKKNGSLSDITPTLLELLNIKKPREMSGESLLKK